MKIIYECSDVTKKFPEYVQAQCISEDCVMGSGVVIAYRNMFPGLKEYCTNYIKNVTIWLRQNPQCWYMHKTRNGTFRPYRHVDQDMVVYNMFTKQKVWMHAGRGMSEERYLENLEQSLEVVRDSMLFFYEKKLAISKIGCGRDRCNWEDVETILRRVFGATDIEICVCEYDENRSSDL